MATNDFNPSDYGATPVSQSQGSQSQDTFNPKDYGATPLNGVPDGSSDMNTHVTSLGIGTRISEGILNTAKDAVVGTGEAGGGLIEGAGKGISQTLKGIGTLGDKFATSRVGKFLFPGYQTPAIYQSGSPESQQFDQSTTPQGLVQTVGYAGEKTAEYLAPGGLESKASGLADAAINSSRLAEKPLLANATKALSTGGITALSTAGVTGVQTGGDTSQMASAGALGGIAGIAGKALQTVAPDLLQSLEKSNLKLTPAQEAKIGPKADAAAKFITDNKITGSEATKYKKLSDVTTSLENTMQASVSNQIQAPKNDLISQLQSIPKQFENDPAIYKAVQKDTQNAINVLNETKKGDKIGLGDLLSGKRSYGKDAFGKATAQVKGTMVQSEGAYAIEEAYQRSLENAMTSQNKSINLTGDVSKLFGGRNSVTSAEFNKVYSNAINAKKLANLAQFKKDSGLVGRLFGLWAGETAGQAIAPGLPGKIIGGGLGEMASTKLPGLFRRGTQSVLRNSQKVVPTAKSLLGLDRTP